MTEREVYVERMKSKLMQWDAEIEKLEAKATAAGADAKVKYEEYLATLKGKRDDASTRLADLRESSGEAWQDIRDGAEHAVNAFAEAIKSTKSKFH